MAITNPSAADLKKTQTYMENRSFDPVYEVLTRIPLTINPISGKAERIVGIQGNPSLSLTYTGEKLTQIVKTINGTTYTKTFTWTGDNLTAVSAWS